MSRARSQMDALTDRERAVVKARREHPSAPLTEIGRLCGIKGSPTVRSKAVSRVLTQEHVKRALAEPPPTIAVPGFSELPPQEQKRWLVGWYVKIVEGVNTPQSERIRALTAIAEMVPGAKVPVGVHHTGTWTLEQFVAAAGGKPADVPDKTPEMPN